MMEKNLFIKILVQVRQRQLSPEEARNQIRGEFIKNDEFIKNRDEPDNLRFWPKGVDWPKEVNGELLSVLEQVRMKIGITTNEAEEDIRRIIEEGIWKTRKKARIRKPQTEQSCCT